MPSHPASRDEIIELIGHVDDAFIEAIVHTQATVEEIAEAIDDLEDRSVQPYTPSSQRVVQVRRILDDIFRNATDTQ